MTKFLLASAAIALAAAATSLSAQPSPPPPPGVAQGTAPMIAPSPPSRTPGGPNVHRMVMSDRTMTRGEVSQHVARLFARLDANHDGYVTRDEVEALHGHMIAGMARGMEGMHRGMEAMNGGMHAMSAMPGTPMPDRAAMFDRLDTNHDGSISRQEYMAAKTMIREDHKIVIRDGNSPGMPLGPDHQMMMRMHGMGEHIGTGMGMGGFGGRLFEMADVNHDGRVSLAEAQAAALAHFDRADLNHDGRITPDERQQTHAMRREHKPS